MSVLKKAFSLLLSSVLLCSSVLTAFAADIKTDNRDITYKGVFYYRSGVDEFIGGTDSVDHYMYSDAYFKTSGNEYNNHLATLSMNLAGASSSSLREPNNTEGYKRKSRNASAMLEDMGFSDIEINEAYTKKPDKNSIGAVCAHKRITQDGKAYTLLVIIPRSTGYEAEWGNNFVLGPDGDAYGFSQAADKCLSFTKSYIEKHALRGDLKVWATGFSRGAAVSNLIGKKLIDEPNAYLGDAVTLTGGNLYDYTFGTPGAADVKNNPRAEKYSGIFNHYQNTEIAAAMAPPSMGFARYGTDRMVIDESRRATMLEKLKLNYGDVYDAYTGAYGSQLYSPKKLSLENGTFTIVDDESSYLPTDAATYIKELGEYLSETTGGRENYSKVYEQPLSDFLAYFLSLTGDDFQSFLSALTSHEDLYSLAAAGYCYYMKSSDTPLKDADKNTAKLFAKELASVSAEASYADTSVPDSSTIYKIMGEIISYIFKSSDQIRSEGGAYLSSILYDAMTASKASQQQINAITNERSSQALFHFISYVLLGNKRQSGKIEPLNIDNEQIKNAVTLISNAGNIIFDHTDEIYISWLRAQDSNFDDYSALTDAQLAGYRRVYIKSEKALNGSVTDKSDKVIAVIKNGVLSETTDSWVGLSSTDDGGFLRIPVDRDYKLELIPTDETSVNVKIGEYSVYSATSENVLNETVTAGKTDRVTVLLPALDEGYEMPSKAEYSVTVTSSPLLGDADMDGTVSVNDASAVQKHIAGLANPVFNSFLADVDADGKVTVLDLTVIQRYLADFEEEYPIEKPINLYKEN